MRPALLVLALTIAGFGEPVFRENFKEVPAHIPVTAEDLTSEFLTLERLGPGADRLKLSFHPEKIPRDPHYIWNGECPGPVLIAFPFQKALDLSDGDWNVRLRTKNFAPSTLHLALRVGGKWIVQEKSVAPGEDWNVQTLPLAKATWRALAPKTVVFGDNPGKVDLTKVEAIGFAAPRKPDRSKDCIRLDWFELRKGAIDGN